MKLCVALDMSTIEQNLNLVHSLKGLDLWLKVGLRSYLGYGKNIIESIKAIDNFKIFLDLKIYDIPKTMADACEVCAKLDVDMINLHASCGKIAMLEVMNRLNKLKTRPLVLAVSALTSFDESEFKAIYNTDIESGVKFMSNLAYNCGLDGMVCSVFESKMVKKSTSQTFITLTPGIRPFCEAQGDQKRVSDINTAIENSSDFIVVGRPIYESKDPRHISQEIIGAISSF